MTASYPLTVSTVNPFSSVSTGAASLYRWVHRWHHQGATVEPHTRYLAAKLGKSERHIYRWLAELRAVEAITCQVAVGVSRRILPLVEPPPLKKKPAPPNHRKRYESIPPKMSGVMSGVLSGVLPVDGLNAENATTNSAVALVALLIGEGITATAAAGLIEQHGEGNCREQVEALPFRKASDRAAVLVASIRAAWALPAGLLRVRDRQRSEEKQAAKTAAAAIVAAHRQKQRQELENTLNGLPDAQKQALARRVEAEYRRSHPSMAARILSLGMAGRLLHEETLRLLAVEQGMEYQP